MMSTLGHGEGQQLHQQQTLDDVLNKDDQKRGSQRFGLNNSGNIRNVEVSVLV